MSTSAELVAAKKNLSDVLGERMKMYLHLLKSWFRQKLTREDFDLEARKLIATEHIHAHNQFLLALMMKCQSLGSSLVSKESSTQSKVLTSPSKVVKKPRLKKKTQDKSGVQPRFTPANPLSPAPHVISKVPEPDLRNISFASRELLLPDIGMVHGRMIVSAWDLGLEDIQDQAVSLVMRAVEVQLKHIITAICSRRSGFKVREGRFKFAMGMDQPSAALRNSLNVTDDSQESEATSISSKGHHMPSIKRSVETSHRDAAVQLACAGEPRADLGPVSLFDLFDALQVYKHAIPSHSVYATNMERIANKMWHPSREEMDQEDINRQESGIKSDLLSKHMAIRG